MIQPIGAFSSPAGYRGFGVKSNTPQERSKAEVALINAAGISVVAGALTTAAARNFTSSWANAFILGICGTVLSWFIMLPLFIEKAGIMSGKKKHETGAIPRDSFKTQPVMNRLRPVRKLVQFGQS